MTKYKLQTISYPEACENLAVLPIELRYIFARYPEYKPKVCELLQTGQALGIRTELESPEKLLSAVHAISTFSQHNFIITWLPALLRDKHVPKFFPEDLGRAAAAGHDLHEAVRAIEDERLNFKRVVLVDGGDNHLVNELSELIQPLAVDYAVFRIVADNANERTEIAQSIVKALLFIGPIAHVLEKFAAGIGKVFAASADDLLGEAAELTALRGSGFTWRELIKRSYILVPIFLLAVWGAYQVEGLLETGHLIWGGAVFGLSAVALSLTTAIQSFFMYRRNLKKLVSENKVSDMRDGELTWLALRQDFTNPARLGLFLGAALAPMVGIIGALLGWMHNGWVLAAIGSTESIVAGVTVILADRLSDWRFHQKLRRRLG